MKKVLKDARAFVEEFSPGYDAHRDGLADVWDHKETVNKLLKHLRAVLEEAEKKTTR